MWKLGSIILAPMLALMLVVTPVSASHCPDYNSDHVISVLDMAKVMRRTGTFQGGPPNDLGLRYSAWYDVNHSGTIDSEDVLLVASLFGQRCPLR